MLTFGTASFYVIAILLNYDRIYGTVYLAKSEMLISSFLVINYITLHYCHVTEPVLRKIEPNMLAS